MAGKCIGRIFGVKRFTFTAWSWRVSSYPAKIWMEQLCLFSLDFSSILNLKTACAKKTFKLGNASDITCLYCTSYRYNTRFLMSVLIYTLCPHLCVSQHWSYYYYDFLFFIFYFYFIHKVFTIVSSICRFIDNAYNAGVPVVLLTAYSKNADKLSRYLGTCYIFGCMRTDN